MKRFAVAGLLLAVVAGAYAQNYPTRPIRFVVPYGAGGAGDIFARTIGQKLADAMGQAVVVDNRGGANGIIGTDLVAKAPPDGYTIVMANSAPFVLNPSLYSKLPYDAVRDFAPVTQGTYYGYVLVVHPSVAAKNVIERLATQGGNELVGNTPDQYAVTIKVEIARYAKIIKSAAITLEK